jgi:hypothetical protein
VGSLVCHSLGRLEEAVLGGVSLSLTCGLNDDTKEVLMQRLVFNERR